MSIISLRISDELLHELDDKAKSLHLARAEYVRQAIEHMNEEITNQAMKQKLKEVSLRVRSESMRINAEFSDIEHDPNN